ncbi:MAG: EamA family transporter, partial [Candidatus Eisenbacteria bacterium]
MKGIPLIILAVMLGATGQIVMKKGMQIYGEVSATSVWAQLIPILKTPQVAIGFLCYGISAVLWIAVVSNVDLSLAYPMVSLAYVIVFVASWLLLGEQISALRLVGLLIIVAGATCFGRLLTLESIPGKITEAV